MRIEIEFNNGTPLFIAAKSLATDDKHLYVIEKVNKKRDYSWKFSLDIIHKITVVNMGEAKKTNA